MFLGTQSWRASLCQRESCRKRFVKDKPSRRYCSEKCSREDFAKTRKASLVERTRDFMEGQQEREIP